MTDPLSIVAFLDGRPGHEKQTRGVLQAMTGLTATDVAYRRIPALSLSVAMKHWFSYLLAAFRPLKEWPQARVDLIIGTGAYTHIPMLLLQQESGGKAVTCMSPDRLLIHRMDLCLVPSHDGMAPADNVFITTGPPNPIPYSDTRDAEKGLILVGGIDRRSHRWDSDGMAEKIEALMAAHPELAWTISSSPRTPADTCRLLEAMAGDAAHAVFVRAEETPPGWIEAAYAHSDTVWVTADSISMIYEALSAGCRVGILPVAWKRKRSKFRRAERSLIEDGWVLPYGAEASGREIPGEGSRLREAERCAEEILRRWWPNRLP